jgi:DNA-binding beta-propeller fold protein YncE/tRNA A-37 threonylcarbamoyl transferase component Bud32
MTVESEPLSGESVAGYRLVSLLARGGTGPVYLAEDAALARRVALKLPQPRDADDAERILRASRLASSLDHPHVVPVYDAGEADGRLYVAMRYVEGSNLRELVARDGPLEPARAVALLAQVADALDAAHERGMVHGDLRAADVLVAAGSGGEHCYLAGLGLSGRADGRADVLALARLLHQCVTGEPAPTEDADATDFDLDTHGSTCGELVAEAARALGLEPPTAPRTLRPARRLRLSRRQLLLAGAAVGVAATPVAVLLRRDAEGLARIEPTSIGVIDPESSRLVDEIRLGFTSHLLTAGEGFLWAADQAGSTLARIDPDQLRVDRFGIGADAVPLAIAAGEGSVWVAVNKRGRSIAVLQLDPQSPSRRPRAEAVLKRATRGTISLRPATHLTVGESAVWAFEPADGDVWRIDPRTGAASLVTRSVVAVDIAAGRGAVWLGGYRIVTKLDPRSGEVLAKVGIVGKQGDTAAIAIGPDAVWRVGNGAAELSRIDPEANAVVDTFDVGAEPTGVAVGEGAVWVANSGDGTVSRVDPSSGDVRTIPLGVRASRIVAAYGRVWTSPPETIF